MESATTSMPPRRIFCYVLELTQYPRHVKDQNIKIYSIQAAQLQSLSMRYYCSFIKDKVLPSFLSCDYSLICWFVHSISREYVYVLVILGTPSVNYVQLKRWKGLFLRSSNITMLQQTGFTLKHHKRLIYFQYIKYVFLIPIAFPKHNI